MIVAIEGLDASGKATQSKLLAETLNAELISFPDYTTPAGKVLLGLLTEAWGACGKNKDWDTVHNLKHVNALVLQSLMTTNRLEVLPRITTALEAGHSIVFDRYYVSGIVYGTLDGLDPDWIKCIQVSLPEPDVWVLLDVSIDESIKRRPERRDRYERDRAFLERVRDLYLDVFRRVDAGRPFRMVDGAGSVEEVAARVWQVVDAFR